MSRCFPFPPPGYEKKTITDDFDLLKKFPYEFHEKQREKKLKKEKKDKVKREGKEKREKDKSDGKRSKKKDKKEKNRDKKKDKGRDSDRDKEKGSNLYEKILPGNSEGHNGEKISTEKRTPGQSASHNGEKLSNEKRFAGRSEGHNGERASYEKRLALLSESHSGENFLPKEEKDKHRNNFSNERSAGKCADNNGEKASRSIHLAENGHASKFARELDRRVGEESRGTEKYFVDKFTGSDQSRNEGMLNPLGKATVNGAGENAKKDKGSDDRKLDGQGIRVDTKFSGNYMVENFTEVVETRVKGIARPLGTNIEQKMEEKEKGGNDRNIDGQGIEADTRFSGNSMVDIYNEVVEPRVAGIARPLGTNGERKVEGKEKTKDKGDDDKHKDRDKKKKKSHGKDRDRDKEKKEEKKKKKKEEAKVKKDNKSNERDQVKESIQNDIISTRDVKSPYLSHDSDKNAASGENLRKRKDNDETNGYLHANKLPRPTPSSNSTLKNGRILDPWETLIPVNSDGQDAAGDLKVGSKDRKVNGAIEAQPASLAKPPLGTAQASKIAPLPHPDSKYLSQILSVPEMEDLPEFDGQDWLFSSSGSLSKKCTLESTRNSETPMVWSQALQIEYADLYALPYVIPY